MIEKNNRFLLSIMMSVVIMTTIYGCDKNENNKEKVTKETTVSEQNDKAGLRQLFKDEKWQDEWTAINENGKDVIITIDADISVPDLNCMSVIEIENLPFTSENKEMFLKGLFDESSIFYNNDKHMTKEQWQKKIETELQDQIDYYEMLVATSKDEEFADEYRKSIQQLYDMKADYEEKMNNAPAEYIKASDFDSDSYIGYIDGKAYRTTFGKVEYSRYDSMNNELGTKLEEIVIESNEQEKPSQLEDAVDVYVNGASSVTEELSGKKNQCQMTKEEAKTYVEKYLNAVGIPNAVCTYIDDLCWSGVKKSNEDSIEYERISILDGYEMRFDVGVDDIPLVSFGEENTYMSYMETDNMSKYNVYSIKTEVIVRVNDTGLINMRVTNPIKINNVTGNVELLPLSNIYKIMTNQINENPDKYGVYGVWAQDDKIYNHMELIYFRVTDRERENHYSYIPVWRLGISEDIVTNLGENKHFRGDVVLVNAIDGSVINLLDELAAGPIAQ